MCGDFTVTAALIRVQLQRKDTIGVHCAHFFGVFGLYLRLNKTSIVISQCESEEDFEVPRTKRKKMKKTASVDLNICRRSTRQPVPCITIRKLHIS